MTKSQMVAQLAEKTGLQKKVVVAIIAEPATVVAKATKSDGEFVALGFGKAIKAHRKELTGRDLQTNGAINLQAKKVFKDHFGKDLHKDAVAGP